jgi:hypothetical protein
MGALASRGPTRSKTAWRSFPWTGRLFSAVLSNAAAEGKRLRPVAAS